MDIVLRHTGISIQPKRMETITPEEIEAGLAAGTLKKVDSYIYEECDPPPTDPTDPVTPDPDPEPEVDPDTGTTTETYSTKVLTAAKSTAKKRSAKK